MHRKHHRMIIFFSGWRMNLLNYVESGGLLYAEGLFG